MFERLDSAILTKFIWIWSQPIVMVSGRTIRVSNLAIALIVFLFGLLVSKLLSKIFERFFFKRTSLDISVYSTARTVSHYILIVLFTFLALHFANIPLTIFTFLGGAVALGVGFGSQNIMNNFISGLIILLERPIKVGDFVNIESVLGKVDHIGARSTRILKTDNTHVMLPNSWLIEKKVLNWNFTDRKIRTSVKVGVAYGSSVEDVIAQLESSCKKNETVLSYPKPIVLFDDFGNSALQFEIVFWVNVRTLFERRIIESELRCSINKAFKENNIVIAFPQQDVHLHSPDSLPVHIVSKTEES